MQETGILGVTAPEFALMVGCAQNKYHEYDVWAHTLVTLDGCPRENALLRLAALFHDIGKPLVKAAHPVTGDATFYEHEVVGAEVTETILNRLKFSTEDRNQIVHYVRHHYIRYESDHSSPAIRRWIRRVGLENVQSLCNLARADIKGKGNAETPLETKLIDELEERIAHMRVTEVIPTSTKILTVNGNDVMTHLGIRPGPAVGKVLTALLEAVTDNPELNTPEKLLALAKEVPL
jgi:tRNA nucleotidyltransferase (CCA-adding enzyme)